MAKKEALQFLTPVAVWFLSIGCVGSTAFASTPDDSKQTTEINQTEPLPLDELRTFAEVYNRIKSAYVDEVDDQTLLEGAIAGMLDSLDPHSTYLNQEAYSAIQHSSAGQYGGLGIEVIPDNNSIRVITPIDNSPAKRAGILPGDLVVKINNTPLRNIKAEDALNLMRGEIGESVHLTISREGEASLLEFDLVRELIKLTSVSSRWLNQDMAYLRITQFQRGTANEMSDAIDSLKQQKNGKIAGLVLDLRNNPGGVLTAAEAVSNAFLNQGLVVSTRGKIDAANYQFSAREGDVLDGAPVVVLINGGSASAAEIVAGALQDHNRAIIMGTRSFGKGSVQTLMPITGEAALKLTTARYFTPSGRSIQGSGIEPDIEVQQAAFVTRDKSHNEVYESDLKGALENDSEVSQAQPLSDKKELQKLLENDYQLSEALNLLRGINILSLKSNN